MKINLFSKLIFAALLAFVVNSFVYFSFGNIYSSTILNYENFQEQFHSGIYQYRILSGYFLVWIYNLLSGLNIDYQIFKFKFLDQDSEPQLFFAFYLLNTFFLVLSSFVMVLITESKNFIATESEKILMIWAAVFVIAISQFVIVPYDVSSYFFLLLFFWIFLKYMNNNSVSTLILLVVALFISTLNRESSALSLSLAAALLYIKFGIGKKMLIPLAILGATFLAVYLGMRFFNESFTTNDGNLLVLNFQPKNILGLLFWVVFFIFTLILSKDKTALRNILIFHLLAAPYILMCLYSGILYEVRLYVPIFLTALFLSKSEFTKFQ